MKIESIRGILTRICEDIDPVGNARVAAAIVYNRKIVSIGYNQYKSDPLQAVYAKNIHAIYMHAEIAAIKKATKLLTRPQMAKCDLHIVRRKCNNGVFEDGLAYPCIGCEEAILHYGIRRVFYTGDYHRNESNRFISYT